MITALLIFFAFAVVDLICYVLADVPACPLILHWLPGSGIYFLFRYGRSNDDFFTFVFGGVPVQKRFQYNAAHEMWCPLCLKWTNQGGVPMHDGKPKIWIRRAVRWFQGKRDHQVP